MMMRFAGLRSGARVALVVALAVAPAAPVAGGAIPSTLHEISGSGQGYVPIPPFVGRIDILATSVANPVTGSYGSARWTLGSGPTVTIPLTCLVVTVPSPGIHEVFARGIGDDTQDYRIHIKGGTPAIEAGITDYATSGMCQAASVITTFLMPGYTIAP